MACEHPVVLWNPTSIEVGFCVAVQHKFECAACEVSAVYVERTERTKPPVLGPNTRP
jgi:hypothetical protein